MKTMSLKLKILAKYKLHSSKSCQFSIDLNSHCLLMFGSISLRVFISLFSYLNGLHFFLGFYLVNYLLFYGINLKVHA